MKCTELLKLCSAVGVNFQCLPHFTWTKITIAVFHVRPEHHIYSGFSHATLKMFHRVTSGVNVYHRSRYLFY